MLGGLAYPRLTSRAGTGYHAPAAPPDQGRSGFHDRRHPLARAKRTDRTAARRRYRADQAAAESIAGTGEPETPGTPARDGSASAPARTASGRPSMTGAFREAFRPLDLRGDLLALPQLVRHWSMWVPAALSIIATVLFVTSTAQLTDPAARPDDMLASVGILGYQLFVAPPPVAAAFLAGFGAPRASWLTGLIVGLVAAFGFAAVVLSPFGSLTYTEPTAWIAQGFIFAPVGGAMFASAAAWYRRFLNLANPNRGRRQPGGQARGGKAKSRPVTSRTGSRR